ncbi:glycosyltransferase family 2 protein [Chloroflexi bacterium TSY]|nr:glycosyltransferase family 2 protein [Chloroflexi bacterium TSY]MBV7330775.1 glycosyltransferase family 2 protein [Chloroflexi bacterium TSY]
MTLHNGQMTVFPLNRFVPPVPNKNGIFPHTDNIPINRIAKSVALIAAYNEARFIGSVVITASRYTERVIVVNDGSTDDTEQIARTAGAIVINMPQNSGKGAALQVGLKAALELDANVIILLDGDGQHAPEETPRLARPILDGKADLVVGSRFMEIESDIPHWRRVGQHVLTWFTNVASGVPLSDSQSGFRALSARAASQLSFSGQGFSIESEMQFAIGEHGLRVQEVPISCIYEEPPKRNPIKHGMQVVDGILKMVLQMRPLFFFGVLSFAILILGLIMGLRVISSFQATAQLAIGHGLLTVMLIVMGSIFFSTGVTLHAIRYFMNKQ